MLAYNEMDKIIFFIEHKFVTYALRMLRNDDVVCGV